MTDILNIVAPSHLFLTAVLMALVWWIRGAADRRRASNEAISVGESVTIAQFKRMQTEIDRLTARIQKLEDENSRKDTQIAASIEAAAKHAAEVIVQTATLAAKDAEIARLLAIIDAAGKAEKLVEATERNAAANERLADATEHNIHSGDEK